MGLRYEYRIFDLVDIYSITRYCLIIYQDEQKKFGTTDLGRDSCDWPILHARIWLHRGSTL